MAFLHRITIMITSWIILYTIPSTTSTLISPDPSTRILIDSICLLTENQYYCERLIVSKLDKPHAEIKTISNIAAFNALNISETTTALIRVDFLHKEDNPLAKTQLRTCLATYHDVDKLLEGAYGAMLRNDYSEMRRYQSNVLGLLDKCKTDFDPMVIKNWWVRFMINISIIASRLLPAH